MGLGAEPPVRAGLFDPWDGGPLPDAARPRAPRAFGIVATTSGTGLLNGRSELAAFSWVIEQDCLADPHEARVFASFVRPGPYCRARGTWLALAQQARSVHVFLTVSGTAPQRSRHPVEVPLDASPEPPEWALIVDRPHGAVALVARERPGQEQVTPAARLYDSAWTTDPRTVRQAAQIYALAAVEAGATDGEDVVAGLARSPLHPRPDPLVRERLLDLLLQRLDEGRTTVSLQPADQPGLGRPETEHVTSSGTPHAEGRRGLALLGLGRHRRGR